MKWKYFNMFFSEIPYHVVQNEYGKYCVPKSSDYTYVSKIILSGKVHEQPTIKYIIDNCNEGDIVHAGAGFGDFLPALSKNCKGKIWTFEPNLENYYCCKETIKLNGLKNVNLFDIGLGEKTCEKLIRVKKNNLPLGTRSETVKKSVPMSDVQKCKIEKLDNIIPDEVEISLIHLDTEGYDLEIIEGCQKIIERCNPIIILEIDNSAVLYNDYMENLGYKPVKQIITDAEIMVFVNTVYKKNV
jgi:FkbM family methyltransferase